jgi:hypothetical protein
MARQVDDEGGGRPLQSPAFSEEAVMPVGGFLDSFPSLLFVAAHVLFLAVGIWAWQKASAAGAGWAPMLWLYVLSQVVFLGFFGGVITMKMSVLIEQTLMVIPIAMVATRK